MIVATAGHVDHGKTTLVRALTGVDTDRLPEERRRGMSIDLGFAHVDGLGFVDVPGHERFVANLLAGVACVDIALLVVAADDGPMPQTREHLAILAALGIDRGLVALTKVDRVGADRLAAARREIDALLAGGPFAGAAVLPVAATTGAGVPALRQALDSLAAALPARRADGAFRLAVDRSFLRDGAGRVVTGAVLSGRVRVGDRVVVSPLGTVLRVRGLHAQGRAAEEAVAGERCALNIAGTALKDAAPVRGDWIVAPAVHAPTDRLDVWLVATATAPLPLPVHVAGLQLHLGAAALPVRLALLGGEALAPGRSGFAQLVLARPVAALHGDRFVLRDPAAGRCVAGGVVVDPFATARARATPARVARLAALARVDVGEALDGVLALDDDGLDIDRFVVARNLDPPVAEALRQRPGATLVDTPAGPRLLATAAWRTLRERVVAALADWHAAQPDSAGPGEPALLCRIESRNRAALARAAIGALADDGRIVRDGFRWRLAGHRVVPSPADALLLARITACLEPEGLRPPIVGELATALGVLQTELLDVLDRAVRAGTLLRVAPNRCFLPATVAALAAHARALAAESPDGFDAAAFRDRTGIGRNLTIEVLEFLDREGVTRFDGRRRVVEPQDARRHR